MRIAHRYWLLASLLLALGANALSALAPAGAFAQDVFDDAAPLEGLPTVISVKMGAGWGIGRARQLYGYNGTSEVYWSTGEGVKLNLALDIPIMPIEVVNTDSFDVGLAKTPIVALELEAGTGYHISTGGTTNDPLPNGSFQSTKRTTGFVPITLGLNARSSFGAGMPSVYVGAGGGVYLVALYQEQVSNSLSPDNSFTRMVTPPLPFGLYGAIGLEFPLAYSPDDGNSFFDLYTELRLTEMSSYVYSYQVVDKNGGTTTVSPKLDPDQLYLKDYQRSASSVALTVGIKFNIY
jgi:hypothetical protein